MNKRSITRRGVAAVLGIASALVGGGALWVGRVEAGYKGTYEVFIDASGQRAGGGLGSARNSADGNQEISCSATASGLNHYLICYAVNSVGESASCYAQDNPASEGIDFAGLTIMTESAYVEFTWDSQGNCTTVNVADYSSLEPKKP